MGQAQNNAQGEMQLVAEWIASLPAGWKSKTHVNVGAQQLYYAGVRLTEAQSRAFGVWNSWCDARIFNGAEVWIVEAKLVATGQAYGQVLDYCLEYTASRDFEKFRPAPVIPVVLTMASRPRTAAYFQGFGVRTIIFQPTFPLSEALKKLFPAAQILHPDQIK